MICEQEMKDLIVYARDLEDKEKIIEYVTKKINEDRCIQFTKQNFLNNKNYELIVGEKQVDSTLAKLNIEEKTINNSEKFLEYRKKLNSSIQEIYEMENMLRKHEQTVYNSIQRIHTKEKNLHDLKQKISETEIKINFREKNLDDKKEEIDHLNYTLNFEKNRLDQDQMIYSSLKN